MSEITNVFSSNHKPTIVLNSHTGFTSGGQLLKGWDADGEYLYKAELEPGRTFCIYSEAICSDLAELLGICHVSYDLIIMPTVTSFDKQPKDRELVSCHTYKTDETEVAITLYELVQEGMSKDEARNYVCSLDRTLYCQMLLFDFLIANTDRHFRNLGVLKGQSSEKMIPLYDHDRALYSLRYNNSGEPFSRVDIWESERFYQGPMYYLIHHAAEIMSPVKLQNLCDWKKLYDVTNILSKYRNLPKERANSIQLMLRLRVGYMLKELSTI